MASPIEMVQKKTKSATAPMVLGLSLVVVAMSGCSGISIAPSCPQELEVGESGAVRAVERDPGAIATYLWEAIPSDAGTFDDATLRNTTFEATNPGEVELRLTASDGFFQVISSCRLSVIEPGDVTVAVEVDPNPVVVGESATLVCRSTGEVVAVTRTIEQADGDPAVLTVVTEGVVTFTPDAAGELTFRCVGLSEGGRESEPGVLSVSIIEPLDQNGSDGTGEDGGDDRDDGRNPPRSGRP